MQLDQSIALMRGGRRLAMGAAAVVGIGGALVFLLPLGSRLAAWPWPMPGYLMGIGGLGCALVAIGAVTTWVGLLQGAWRRYGAGYALGHFALSLILTPLALVGLALVPALVEREMLEGSAETRTPLKLSWLDLVAFATLAGLLLFATR